MITLLTTIKPELLNLQSPIGTRDLGGSEVIWGTGTSAKKSTLNGIYYLPPYHVPSVPHLVLAYYINPIFDVVSPPSLLLRSE